MILLIDNYDSFVCNLARYFQRLGHATRIVRNDALPVETIRALEPAAIVLSPGPCRPRQAGCSIELVRQLTGVVPMLGVCLGHQAIVEAWGGRVVRAPKPMHGRSSRIRHDRRGAFAGLPNPMQVGRYHSLIVDRASVPRCFEITAVTDDGLVMAVRHRAHRVIGLQFHPESILTEHGYPLLAGFLRQSGLEVPPVVPCRQDERIDLPHPPGPRPASSQLTGVTF